MLGFKGSFKILLLSSLSFFVSSNAFAVTGDTNGDGLVDKLDLSAVSEAYEAVTGDSRYNANADLNNDGRIDFGDLLIVAQNFSGTPPYGSTIKGDGNGDGFVDENDLVELKGSYNSIKGQVITLEDGTLVEYNPKADNNKDGRVDFGDLVNLAQNYTPSSTGRCHIPQKTVIEDLIEQRVQLQLEADGYNAVKVKVKVEKYRSTGNIRVHHNLTPSTLERRYTLLPDNSGLDKKEVRFELKDFSSYTPLEVKCSLAVPVSIDVKAKLGSAGVKGFTRQEVFIAGTLEKVNK